MEAVPKLSFLSFDLKISPENTHFGPKLKQYIAEVYREDPESYGNEVHQLEGLRSAAVRPTNDVEGLKALNRYFCQLRAMQSRFPMAKGQPAACTFVWKDLYANMNCSLADLKFEMACILYNIGALHTQLASSETRTSPDSLKLACQHFQNAAWTFQHLMEQYPQPSGADVSPEILKLLQEICFAQAQECILDKSRQDTRKPSVIGAVATQVLYFYKNSLAILGPSTGTDNIHEIIGTKLYNVWYRHLSFKSSYVGCIVSLYQGIHAEEQQKMGERVAYYQQAVDKLNEARKLAKYIEPVQVTQEALTFTNDVVEGKRKAAKNENEFIYHEEVPDKDVLSELKPVCLVKVLAINFNDPEVAGQDIFSRLVPIGAHEASSLYSEEKAKLLRQVVSQVEAKNLELSEFMSSLQLDQLDVLDADQKIPQEIVDRCAAMNAKTEIISTLVDSMNNLAELISDVEHTLGDIKAIIQEESQMEKEYQKTMGPRPPSLVQTELARELHKYNEAHARTSDSNQVLHKAMTLHIANLQLLAQPLDQLQEKIPSVDNIEGLDRNTMGEMRRVVGKAREMQAQRTALVAELRATLADDDVTALLLADPHQPHEELFKREIEKHTPKVKIIEQNLAAQENIINRLTSLYASYGDSRRLLADVLRKRDAMLSALVTSYDSFGELVSKSAKGLEFYRKLQHNLNALLARARSVCQVQREEREQMRSTVKAPATTKSSSVTPTMPPSSGTTPKLKDYLPYMKNRSLARNVPPQVSMEMQPPDSYPDPTCPTSVRPTPVGSEATEVSQPALPDGVGYANYPTNYMQPDSDPYSKYGYPVNKQFNKTEQNQSFNYPGYSQPQYLSSAPEQQSFSNPYQATSGVSTPIMDPQAEAAYSIQTNLHSGYPGAPLPSLTDMSSSMNVNQDLSSNFSQMHFSAPKSEAMGNYSGEYSQTYFSVHYPPSSSNVATYSHAPQNINTNSSTQLSSQYAMNYPQAPIENEYGQNTGQLASSASNSYANYSQSAQNVSSAFTPASTNVPNAYQSYSEASPAAFSNVTSGNAANPYFNSSNTNMYIPPNQAPSMPSSMPNQMVAGSAPNASSQYVSEPQYAGGFNNTINDSNYTNANQSSTSTASGFNSSVNYNLPTDSTTYVNPALAQIDELDQPIKSHAKGEALSMPIPNYQNYNMSTNVSFPSDQNTQSITMSAQYSDTTNSSYGQTYQNHPGYTYNANTGNYDYSYGSQNSYTNYEQQNVDYNPQKMGQEQSFNQSGVYTSAGTYNTMQSPSEATQPVTLSQEQGQQQNVYNNTYGYNTISNQTNEGFMSNAPHSAPAALSAVANQVSFTNEISNESSVVSENVEIVSRPPEMEPVPPVPEPEVAPVNTVEESKEPTTFDLLSDIDFSVEQKPLLPEIKVPQISDKAIFKSPAITKVDTVKPPPEEEEKIQRPVRRDLFSDPSLVNRFTQEVKRLQQITDSLINKTPKGLTVLDSKWKQLQDSQNQENMNKSKRIVMERSRNIVSDVVPYDDSRLRLKTDPDAYINASYYKQLSSWCVPLVISKCPDETDTEIFWKAMFENNITCIVCLLTEIEMQGAPYWPTAKGQTLGLNGIRIMLEEVRCSVHWTERKLILTQGSRTHSVTHYQINVFPVKVLCSPLVLLCDAVLRLTSANGPNDQLSGACLHCSTGAGRSALVALLLMLISQVRAGYLDLVDELEAGCMSLCRGRTGVLADPKYLADAYRAALFYAQGVLCSGSTLFNGESVSFPSGAGVLPQSATTPTPSTVPTASGSSAQRTKFNRESFEEMRQAPGLKNVDMKDPLNFLDPLWTLKKK
ncbi:unnamed protein product [Leptosia nina]|uniref:Tyrosine-protein phosphatase non-receptor type 23 n=1 Tax=Leptosia nina TaxID=320188 RepID=A0AAV1J4K8_9NEOP